MFFFFSFERKLSRVDSRASLKSPFVNGRTVSGRNVRFSFSKCSAEIVKCSSEKSVGDGSESRSVIHCAALSSPIATVCHLLLPPTIYRSVQIAQCKTSRYDLLSFLLIPLLQLIPQSEHRRFRLGNQPGSMPQRNYHFNSRESHFIFPLRTNELKKHYLFIIFELRKQRHIEPKNE